MRPSESTGTGFRRRRATATARRRGQRAPGVARDWLQAAVEQVLVVGTDAERSRILGMFAISDNDWRVRQVKTLIETAPWWLRNPNPHDGFQRPLGALVVEAALGRVVLR